jgi:hypothetical protein
MEESESSRGICALYFFSDGSLCSRADIQLRGTKGCFEEDDADEKFSLAEVVAALVCSGWLELLACCADVELWLFNVNGSSILLIFFWGLVAASVFFSIPDALSRKKYKKIEQVIIASAT